MTPDELREIARVLDQEGKKLVEQGEPVKGARAFKTAQDFRTAASELEGLRPAGGHAKVVTDKMLSPAVRKRKNLSISETRAPEDAFAAACRAAGFSIRSLAKKLKITPGALFNYRSGARKAPRPITRRIEELTGFADTTDNWPNRE